MSSEILYLLSGGLDNRDQSKSLGGPASTQPLVGSLNNLFDDVLPTDKDTGAVSWRCLYVNNSSKTTIFYNSNFYILSEIANSGNIDLGYNPNNDQQLIRLASLPFSGNIVLGFQGNSLHINWDGSIEFFAANILAAFIGLLGDNTVIVTNDTQSVTVEFLSNKFQPFMTIVANSLGVDVFITKIHIGSPVNTTAVEIDNDITPPSNMQYFYPTNDEPLILGNFLPGDQFPIWVRRTIDVGSTNVSPDGVTLRFSGETLS